MENTKIFKTFAKGLYVNVWKNTTEKQGLEYNFFKVDIQDTYKDKNGERKFSDKIDVDRLPLLIASLQRIYDKFSVVSYDENNKVVDVMR